MDAKFFDSLYEGDSPNGVKLGMGVIGGDFWPRPAGCHTVYRGQDGSLDYGDIMAVMNLDYTDVTINNQDLPANTIWHYIRRQVSDCGLESPDSPVCVVVIDENGDMIGDTPNPPTGLSIVQVVGGVLRLRWRYPHLGEEITPTGFHIYLDSGSGFNFSSPHTTVSYINGKVEYLWTSAALAHGNLYRFVVRSYRQDAGEEHNLVVVSALADSQGPAVITGLQISWEET